MDLGVNMGYFGLGMDTDQVAVAQEADRLGYSVAWVAEAYGSDAPTVLSWIGAKTERIGIGAAVMQIPARTPAMTAMTAATLDTLSEGRFRLGLGSQIKPHIEKRYGATWSPPAARMREIVLAVKAILTSWQDGTRLDFRGEHTQHTLMPPTFVPGPNPYGPPPVLPQVVDVSTGHLGVRSWSNTFGTPLPRTAQLLADPLTGARQLLAALRGRVAPESAASRAARSRRRVRRVA